MKYILVILIAVLIAACDTSGDTYIPDPIVEETDFQYRVEVDSFSGDRKEILRVDRYSGLHIVCDSEYYAYPDRPEVFIYTRYYYTTLFDMALDVRFDDNPVETYYFSARSGASYPMITYKMKYPEDIERFVNLLYTSDTLETDGYGTYDLVGIDFYFDQMSCISRP